MEVDPCTGQVTETTVGTAASGNKGPRNKFEWRASSTTRTKYTREYLITGSTGTQSTNGGQITAGQYVQPVTEWIFPENAVMGVAPAKNDFTGFTHLVNGLGPDENNPTQVWGQLDPFPGKAHSISSFVVLVLILRRLYDARKDTSDVHSRPKPYLSYGSRHKCYCSAKTWGQCRLPSNRQTRR
jgi:hypothetical protein